jgi:hypothetical protein
MLVDESLDGFRAYHEARERWRRRMSATLLPARTRADGVLSCAAAARLTAKAAARSGLPEYYGVDGRLRGSVA